MLNVHLLQFGGPQQRTISVEEPRENNKQVKKAAYQNSAQRQPPGEGSTTTGHEGCSIR